MFIFSIKLNKAICDRIISNNNYDINIGHVIIAEDRTTVLELAKLNCADEEPNLWHLADIKRLGVYTGLEKKSFIILTDREHGSICIKDSKRLNSIIGNCSFKLKDYSKKECVDIYNTLKEMFDIERERITTSVIIKNDTLKKDVCNEKIDTFKTRLLEEQQLLQEKINKLDVFLLSDGFNKLDSIQQSLLQIQSSAMDTYNTCLEEHIKSLQYNKNVSDES